MKLSAGKVDIFCRRHSSKSLYLDIQDLGTTQHQRNLIILCLCVCVCRYVSGTRRRNMRNHEAGDHKSATVLHF